MIKTPISLQDLRRRIYVKAKAEPTWRFWGLYVHICKMETLHEAYQLKVARRIQDASVMKLLKMILKSTGTKGVPQGGVISPVLSNLYLTEVDRMLEKAIATTRRGQYPNVQYARYADDLVVLIDSHPRHEWIVKAVEKRLREELAKLRVEINEEKSRMVDLSKGEIGRAHV